MHDDPRMNATGNVGGSGYLRIPFASNASSVSQVISPASKKLSVFSLVFRSKSSKAVDSPKNETRSLYSAWSLFTTGSAYKKHPGQFT